MRRALVLTDIPPRHPLRLRLPPGPGPRDRRNGSVWRLTRDDLEGFATVYFATFAAVLVFLA
jgi:hypothetical protein